jgi:hypothetical protein
MTDVVLLEASLFQLKTAVAGVQDPMFETQLRLAMDVLSGAVAGAAESLSSATINDVDFALNDVVATVGELSAADAAAITPALELVQADVAALKQATALPQNVVGAVRAFQSKLRTRRTAIERQTYRAEGAPEEPLPHPPEELKNEAVPLRQMLAEAGFVTPALDDLIADPSSLRFHSIGDILDELDVITG